MAKFYPKGPKRFNRPSSSSGATILYWLVGAFIVLGGVYLLMKTQTPREGFADKNITVTYYYLEECPWCNKFKPEWNKFKTEAAKNGINAVEVDGEKNQELVKEKKIKGFPSIWIQDSEYTGERTADALLRAAKSP